MIPQYMLPSDFEDYPVFYGAVAVFGCFILLHMLNSLFGDIDPLGRTLAILGKFSTQEKSRNIKVDDQIDIYNKIQEGDDFRSLNDRNSAYATLVNSYYELATLFYEWGWGQSFHFSYFLPGESFEMAIKRHEYYIASKLNVKAGDKILDCGCGVGGPMRNIAKFTSTSITGITLNQYQVIRGNDLNTVAGLQDEESIVKATSIQANFMEMPFEDNHFDGVYAIEATCHAPEREGVYNEIYRVLKPGQIFACYEWCLTPKYDKENAFHRKIKKKIEEGDGLPDMATQSVCVKALESVGFEVIEYRDMSLDQQYGGDPWWLPLWPSWNPFTFRFQMTEFGKFLTRNLLWIIEFLWLAPAGSYKVQEMLQQGGWGCAQGGYTGTFTPMFLMVARKPKTVVDHVIEATKCSS